MEYDVATSSISSRYFQINGSVNHCRVINTFLEGHSTLLVSCDWHKSYPLVATSAVQDSSSFVWNVKTGDDLCKIEVTCASAFSTVATLLTLHSSTQALCIVSFGIHIVNHRCWRQLGTIPVKKRQCLMLRVDSGDGTVIAWTMTAHGVITDSSVRIFVRIKTIVTGALNSNTMGLERG